jgi:hypothetical protein
VLLNRTDGAVDQAYLAVGDKIYNGDRTKWLKFAHGLKALHLNHFSNKASYDAAAVIAEVDAALAGNGDDALLAYPCTSTDFADCNFWGRSRNNVTLYRQTEFIVSLMNGAQFGGVVDPRMSRMLALDSANTTYRGLNVNTILTGVTVPQQPRNFFGYTGSNGLGLPSRYLFADRSRLPAMTYAQLQFVKAEAALRSGQPALARTAYLNGISSHIDFVNARNLDAGQTPTQISAGEKSAFLADTNIAPATVTLSHIMSQKFIAQWAWGHNELWMDMRRFHYDPTVFRGFTPPTTLYGDNGGKIVYRIRPRYNSEYVWNYASLQAIGADAVDYHTKLLWITEP